MNELSVELRGVVTPFAGNGRKLGYPTANIRTSTDLNDGVYFGWASLPEHQHQPALIFIGTPTSVGDKERRVEAHILDVPDVDYYDLPLQLYVAHFHRANKHFGSLDELKAAMKDDEQVGREWFARNT